MCFAAPWHVESSLTRDLTGVLCIAKQIPNHWTTKEAQHDVFEIQLCHGYNSTIFLFIAEKYSIASVYKSYWLHFKIVCQWKELGRRWKTDEYVCKWKRQASKNEDSKEEEVRANSRKRRGAILHKAHHGLGSKQNHFLLRQEGRL